MNVKQRLLFILIFIFTSVLHSLAISRPTAITLENNEYKNVLVAIHENVAEDKTIIDKIKAMFTEASAYMYVGTRKRAFFKQIKILVPSSWTDDPSYTPASSEIYTNADVAIAEMTPRYRDRPYSRTFSGCGHPGIRIHLTPKFLTDPSSKRKYGPAGRVLVHEWGHFRWGVFDEYPLPGEQEFYFSPLTGKYEAVRCNIHMYGQILFMDLDGNPIRPIHFCRPDSLDNVTGRYPEACRFHADPRANRNRGISASIMDRQEIETIINFCDDDQSDSKKVHNSEAPNTQNRMCGQRSTWAVISESEDFKNGKNPPRTVSDTSPTFVVLKASKSRRVALVLDSSGSMQRDHKLIRMRQTASNFIRHGVDEDADVGVIAFSSTAHVLNPMGKVNSTSVKHAVMHELPKLARGGTSVGAGIEKAIKVITSDGRNASGAVILIITDGKETEAPFVKDVIPKVKDSGVILSIVSLNQDPDDNLALAAAVTGGRFYFDSNHVQSTALEDAIFDFRDSLGNQTTRNSVQLLSRAQGLWSGMILEGTVSLDSSVGKSSQFLMTYQKSEPSLELISPSGRLYKKLYPEYSCDDDFKVVRIEIPGIAEEGVWRFRIRNRDKNFQKVCLLVTSKAVNPQLSSIRVEAAVSPVNVTWPPEVIVYAEVTQNGHPVTGLSVTAVIDRPFADPCEMSLFDNGAGADITKNDGVYSRYFTNYTGNGRYSVRIEVTGQGVVKRYKTSVNGASSNTFNRSTTYTESFTWTPLTSVINRVVTGGVFEFRHPNVSGSLQPFSDQLLLLDQLSPGRITDLKVMKTRHKDNTVLLSWTAPGDDFDHNTATQYEILTAPTADDLLSRRSSCKFIRQDDVTAGNLRSPQTAGSIEMFTLKMKRGKNANASFVFTIRALDDVGHVGDFSNFATAGFGFVPDYVDPAYSEIVQHPVAQEATLSNSEKIVIASVVGSFTVLLALVIIVSFFLYICSRKSSESLSDKSLAV